MITPIVDFCGKEIFENETVRRYFLSAVLRIPLQSIKTTRILNSFLQVLLRNDKEGILDVLIELMDGRKINIEIQVASIKYWDRRSIFYLSKLYVQHFHKGGNYKDLKSCINISILDFNYLDTEKYHTVFRFRDDEGNEYSDALEIHIIELNKLKVHKQSYVNEYKKEMSDMQSTVDEYEEAVQEWIQFFSCKDEEDVKMLNNHTKNPGIKEAIAELMSINASTMMRERYEARLKARRDQAARDEYVWDEGKAEGRSFGRTEGENIKLISLVRKKAAKQLSPEECAMMLEEENVDLVRKIYQLINEFPELDNEGIYKHVQG